MKRRLDRGPSTGRQPTRTYSNIDRHAHLRMPLAEALPLESELEAFYVAGIAKVPERCATDAERHEADNLTGQ